MEHNDEMVTDVDEMLSALRDAVPLSERFRRLMNVPFAKDSVAMQDMAVELGSSVFLLAVSAYQSGIDHFRTWMLLATRDGGVQPIYAHATLARSAIEGAVRCRWLVDPDTSQADRIARGAGVQLVDHRERRNYEEALAPNPPRLRAGAKRAAEREHELENALARLGISSIAPPSATELFRRFAVPDEHVPGEGKALFHLLCGYAHNHQWILATASLSQGSAVPAVEARLVQVSARMDVAASFAVAGRGALTVALDELEGYAGRPERSKTKEATKK